MRALVPDVPLTPADLDYLAAEFVTLDELCAGRRERPAQLRAWMAAGAIASAPYVLDDGERVARDQLRLVDDAGGVERLPAEFARRLRAAGAALDEPIDDARLADEWQSYLSGAYFVCLREVTPEHIVRKEQLVRRLTDWLAAPAPAERAWRSQVTAAVDALDALERAFAPCDRLRWGGPVSRDRLITAARRLLS